MPTLKQTQVRQPDAVMKWFARGKLWESPEQASETMRAERFGEGVERRGAGWRPGGEHEDPRAKFKVPRAVKRARFVERMNRDDDAPDADERDGDDAPAPAERAPRPEGERPPRPSGGRPFKPAGNRPFRPESQNRRGGADRPFKPRPDDRGDRPFKPAGDRPFRPKGPSDRPFKPAGDRPFKPKGPGDRPFRPGGGRGPGGFSRPPSGGRGGGFRPGGGGGKKGGGRGGPR